MYQSAQFWAQFWTKLQFFFSKFWVKLLNKWENCIYLNKREIAPSCAWVFSELARLSALIKWFIDHRNIAIIPSDISFCKNGL